MDRTALADDLLQLLHHDLRCVLAGGDEQRVAHRHAELLAPRLVDHGVDLRHLRASDARVHAQAESARAAVSAFKALGGGWEPDTPATIASK